jgi:hypothetical protein
MPSRRKGWEYVVKPVTIFFDLGYEISHIVDLSFWSDEMEGKSRIRNSHHVVTLQFKVC